MSIILGWFSNTSIITLVTCIIFIFLGYKVVLNYIFYRGKKRQIMQHEEYFLLIKEQLKKPESQTRSMGKWPVGEEPAPPWFNAFFWMVYHPRQVRTEYRYQLERIVDIDYQKLLSSIVLQQDIAPGIGLFFTVVGLLLALGNQSVGGDIHLLLGDMGLALYTSAGAGIIMILQRGLQASVEALAETEFQRGEELINTWLDRKLLPSGQQPQGIRRGNGGRSNEKKTRQ